MNYGHRVRLGGKHKSARVYRERGPDSTPQRKWSGQPEREPKFHARCQPRSLSVNRVCDAKALPGQHATFKTYTTR